MFTRRRLLGAGLAGAAALALPRLARAIGPGSKFRIGQLNLGTPVPRIDAVRRMTIELDKRTVIACDFEPPVVAPTAPTLHETPFLYLSGDRDFAVPPPAGVEIVSRDRNASPEPGLYNICYVNGYQTQPDEEEWWLSEHPDLILRDADGNPVIDPDWDEMLLDISTPEKRAALAEIVGGWITGCGADGFDAVEIDNLDTYSRSDGLLTQDHAVAFMSLLSQTAHDGGMAIAQKNSAEIVDRQAELGTDFVVAEECNRWDECQVYTDVYGGAVLVIEYRQEDFDVGCAAFPGLSIVLRDLDLVPAGDPSYVFDGC